ncbi:hypothetical protein [Rhizobium sp. MHM7A]|uniref:DUF7946 domain-containing protein n=1 Tax=Rhizobium sp. MHM7A TaxID=2583233 RepID=UPI0011061ECD|nr:hypothetical protein [Rhizobium sp. MHM7A]TLX14373.1 hypothetical protein FFR93_11445 [Rhizobium sp. MHM7A]
MVEGLEVAAQIPFRLRLTGDIADQHQFQGYDGYMALAGFAWALSLISNYADTGQIRQRGDFDGRHAVRARAPVEGSVIADFVVYMQNNPETVFGMAAGGLAAPAFLYALANRVINRNLGETNTATDQALGPLITRRGGDIEALVAISEPPIRQAHGVIGNGARNIEISGGFNILNTFNEQTRDYVKLNVEDDNEKTKSVSVSAFNANSGYGSVFDGDLGHVVPFSMSRETLRRYKAVFSWGLDQYVQGTGRKIDLKFTRILAMDGRPKRYIVLSANRGA